MSLHYLDNEPMPGKEFMEVLKESKYTDSEINVLNEIIAVIKYFIVRIRILKYRNQTKKVL